MRSERNEQSIAVYLTAEEVFCLQAGQTVGERLGVTVPESKVEVLPLCAVEEDDSLKDKRWSDDRLNVGQKALLRGRLYTNGDLQVIVSAITLNDVRIRAAHLPREKIETPMTDDRGFLTHVIPEGGVIVHLGGSLQIVDLYAETVA